MPAAWAKLAARSGARPVPGRDREGAGPPLNGRDAFEPAPTRHPGPCTPDQHARPETELIGALESGQIDYLAIYLSDARQHHFKYLDLPAQINLSDARYAKDYAQAAVKTANGVVTGVPTVYAITIPTNAAHPDWAAPSSASCSAEPAARRWRKRASAPCSRPMPATPARCRLGWAPW